MPTLILMAILEQDWHLWAEDLCLNANYAKKEKRSHKGRLGASVSWASNSWLQIRY